MTTESSTTLVSTWPGDVLRRDKIGFFLHRFLVQTHEAKTSRGETDSICFALDGDWGTGKSFFVRHWAKYIENNEHPVIFFDAWKNDLAEDPLLGLIAAMKAQLKKWEKTRPVSAKAKKKLSAFIRQASRAAVPTLGAIGKGLFVRYVGTGLEEIINASKGAETEEEDARRSDSTITLERMLDASLDEHGKQIDLVESLKTNLTELLDELATSKQVSLPMFVFIDELDRCRPPYAIKLLEGVKHLFDAANVCFCFSVNIAQLSESVKAVYGQGFNSYMYLKRFFIFDYRLPEPNPDDYSFCKLLCETSALAEISYFVSGLPDWRKTFSAEQDRDSTVVALAKTLRYISICFKLDLRSQRQVLLIAEAAAAGIDRKFPVHIFFLLALAAIRHLRPEMFRALEITPHTSLIKPIIDESQAQSFMDYDRKTGDQKRVNISPLTILDFYFERLREDMKDLFDKRNVDGQSPFAKYPKNIVDAVLVEFPNGGYSTHQPYPSTLAAYHSLIEQAGQLIL